MQEVPQEVVCMPHPELLATELNKAIRNGWRVIPGSIVIGPKSPAGKVEQQCMAIIYRESPTVPEPPATAAEAKTRLDELELKAAYDARIKEMRKEAEKIWWDSDVLGINGMTAKGAVTTIEFEKHRRMELAAIDVYAALMEKGFTESEVKEVLYRASK